MKFFDTNINKHIHLINTNHTKINRAYEKGNLKYRLPPSFNNTLFKSIISSINLSSFLNEYIVLVLDYDFKEKLNLLIKVEFFDNNDSVSVVLISSLITKNSILPFKRVSIEHRFFLDNSYENFLNQIKEDKINKLKTSRIMEENFRMNNLNKNIKPLRNTLTIVKKKTIF